MKSRSYGIDLLKSVSMYMVVILHILGVGGILAASTPGSWAGAAAWYLETLNMCAVNCFGLVSGYVLCRGHYRRSRLLSLWLRVVLESFVITAVFAAFKAGSVLTDDWLRVFTPVIHNVYWYFTAYFALFFFVPYINKMIAALSNKEKLSLSISIVLVFVFINDATSADIYFLHGGYSFLWLLCLYLLGACMRSIEIRQNLNKYWFLAAYFICSSISFAAMKLLDSQAAIAYTSPFTLFSAMLLLLFFRRLEIRSPRAIKFISMLARTSFGVYIIHTQRLIWIYFLTDRFVPYLKLPIPAMLVVVILTAAAIYSVCTLGDWLAEKFFKLVHIERLERAVDNIGKNRRKTQISAQK